MSSHKKESPAPLLCQLTSGLLCFAVVFCGLLLHRDADAQEGGGVKILVPPPSVSGGGYATQPRPPTSTWALTTTAPAPSLR